MKQILMIAALVLAGCASQDVATAPPVAAGVKPVALTDSIADAKKRGYTVVDQNGQELVCRTQLRTGSRLNKDTYCFTPAEYEAMRRRAEEGLANTERVVPPPQGK